MNLPAQRGTDRNRPLVNCNVFRLVHSRSYQCRIAGTNCKTSMRGFKSHPRHPCGVRLLPYPSHLLRAAPAVAESMDNNHWAVFLRMKMVSSRLRVPVYMRNVV
jgi:hypothetical protein